MASRTRNCSPILLLYTYGSTVFINLMALGCSELSSSEIATKGPGVYRDCSLKLKNQIGQLAQLWYNGPSFSSVLDKYLVCVCVYKCFSCYFYVSLGIAKLVTESRHDIQQVSWVLPPGISQSQLGGVFKLDWLHRLVCELGGEV